MTYQEIVMIMKAINGKYFYWKRLNEYSISIKFSDEAYMITACNKTIYYKTFILMSTYNHQITWQFTDTTSLHHVPELQNNNKKTKKDLYIIISDTLTSEVTKAMKSRSSISELKQKT